MNSMLLQDEQSRRSPYLSLACFISPLLQTTVQYSLIREVRFYLLERRIYISRDDQSIPLSLVNEKHRDIQVHVAKQKGHVVMLELKKGQRAGGLAEVCTLTKAFTIATAFLFCGPCNYFAIAFAEFSPRFYLLAYLLSAVSLRCGTNASSKSTGYLVFTVPELVPKSIMNSKVICVVLMIYMIVPCTLRYYHLIGDGAAETCWRCHQELSTAIRS